MMLFQTPLMYSSGIIDFDFSDAFITAIEEKQVAQQQLLKAETEKQTKITNAEAEAQVKITQAEAEAKANRLLNQELSDKIIQKQFIEKWNGELPMVSGEGSILNIPEEIFKKADKQ